MLTEQRYLIAKLVGPDVHAFTFSWDKHGNGWVKAVNDDQRKH